MPIREILTQWTSPQSPGGTTVMYFNDTETIEDQRAALQTFWETVAAGLVIETTWQIAQEGRVLSATTGVLDSLWSEPTFYTGVGERDSEPVPNAAQLLLRWVTGQVADGRVIKGRNFVPGASMTVNYEGQVIAVFMAQVQAAMGTFVVESGLQVWHRPRPATDDDPGRLGNSFIVNDGSVWQEWAVQRKRR
uniref:Uncharacterized protein n=1 Tax=uncultured prokaryote TaxID=198431 RepID=A0A0H5Q682_9ZZZZ|nr:hypothetical protein [uncultured prokaryote]